MVICGGLNTCIFNRIFEVRKAKKPFELTIDGMLGDKKCIKAHDPSPPDLEVGQNTFCYLDTVTREFRHSSQGTQAFHAYVRRDHKQHCQPRTGPMHNASALALTNRYTESFLLYSPASKSSTSQVLCNLSSDQDHQTWKPSPILVSAPSTYNLTSTCRQNWKEDSCRLSCTSMAEG